MNKSLASLLAALMVMTGMSLAHANPPAEQGEARKEQRAGNVKSLRQIEGRVLPRMRGKQYLGPEYDPAAMVYRLKFISDGRVEFVDVDARSGRILSFSD